jgi:hypothetical protein
MKVEGKSRAGVGGGKRVECTGGAEERSIIVYELPAADKRREPDGMANVCMRTHVNTEASARTGLYR